MKISSYFEASILGIFNVISPHFRQLLSPHVDADLQKYWLHFGVYKVLTGLPAERGNAFARKSGVRLEAHKSDDTA
jgi:hypothetical protein